VRGMIRMKDIEKIEVSKNNGNFYYTGTVKPDPSDADYVIVETTRGEVLKFRKEQIQQRMKWVDKNGKDNQNI